MRRVVPPSWAVSRVRATHHWVTFRNFGWLRLKGRWLVARSLEHYVQECTTFLHATRLSRNCREKVEIFANAASGLWKRYLQARAAVQQPRLLIPMKETEEQAASASKKRPARHSRR